MNLQAIVVANLTGFLLILFLYISRVNIKTKSDTQERVFDTMMALAMVSCIIEPVTFAVDGIKSPIGYWINLLGNTCLYYANGLGSFFWLMYVDLHLFHSMARIKKIYYKLAVPVSVLLLSLFGNIKFHYYFYVDDSYVYHRQPTVSIFYIYMIFCALYSIGLYLYYKKENGRVAFFPIYMYLIPIIAGCIIQMVFYGLSTAWLGTAIGLVALYMSLQQQRTYIDPLTGLYNRMYLAHALYKMKKDGSSWYGIMVDMNDFKCINDTYGHSAGDQALIDASQIFTSSLDANATCFRYAGDEFIILLRTDDEQYVSNLETKMKSSAEDFNNTKKRSYQISFAMGHSKYDSASDNTDSFLRRIDTAMYLDKKRFHDTH